MPFGAFLNSQQRHAKALQVGGKLFCAWLILVGLGVSVQMLAMGTSNYPILALHLSAPLVACIALWLGQRGHWQPVAVGLIIFVMAAMFVLDHGKSEYVVASLMNIAVLTLFAAWMLGSVATALVVVVLQIQLVMLVMQGAYRWSAMLPMMLTCLFLGCVAIFARRTYDRYIRQLDKASEEIAKHQDYTRQLISVVEQSPYSIEIIDLDGRIVYANAAYLKQMGYTKEEVLGQMFRDFSMQGMDDESYQNMRNLVRAGHSWHGVVQNPNKAGEIVTEQVSVAPIYDESGSLYRFVQSKLDISERVDAQERIQKLMYFDKLTQLPNRLALLRKLDEMLQQERKRLKKDISNQCSHIWHGVLVLDMDRFNLFNLAHGSEWGDSLLMAVAMKLQRLQLEFGQMWVARYTADQFVVVLERVGSSRMQARSRAREIAETMQHALTSVALPGHSLNEVAVSFGVGITVFPFVEPDMKPDTSDRIMRRATIALAHAKHVGLHQIQAYAEELAEQAESYMELETELRQAIEQGQLRIYVQPQYDKDSHVAALEVLVRWQHPEKGLLAPSRFITVAEQSGLIVPLGDWMLEQACELLRSPLMQQRGYSVSVNVSANQFLQPHFVDSIKALLERTQVPAQRLVLEVTESMLLADIEEAIHTMNQLRSIGVELALDDFGTGYSSLSYLGRLPIHELKIDRSFIQGIDPSGGSGVLVQAVLMIAKQMGLRVVAEGIEEDGDAHLLQGWEPAILCQGYAFSKPMPAAQWLQHLEMLPADAPVGKFVS